MRVLFLHSAPDWSGSARVFASAAAGLARRGYQVTYVCPPESETEERLAGISEFDVIPVETGGTWANESRRLRRVLLDKFVEAVFVHTEREHLVAASATRWAERGAIVRRTPAGGTIELNPATNMALRLATGGFLFTSEGEKLRAPVPKRALEPVVADLGVDVATYDRVQPAAAHGLGGSTGTRFIACVYDANAAAGSAMVMRTMALLAPRHPELRLVFVGPGSDNEDLRMHAAALRIGGLVRFLGEREDQLEVLRAADLGWVVAEQDNAAYGVLDCMGLRVPVLAARSSVAERFVADGITGVLVAPDDAPATAATIASLLAHGDERAAMGNAGRLRVAREFPEGEMIDGFQRAIDVARDRSRWTV